MSEELSIVAKQQAMILDLMNEIKQLKNVVKAHPSHQTAKCQTMRFILPHFTSRCFIFLF